MTPPEAQLVAAAAAGSREAFDELVRRHRRRTHNLVLALTKGDTEAEDLVQETMMRALTYRHQFSAGTRLKSWLFTIMRNTFINNYRRNKCSNTLRDTTKNLYYLNIEDPHTFSRPEESLQFGELWRCIHSISSELSVPFKMFATGYKYQEIAEHLHVPLGTVKNRIFQARKEIQKRLSGYSVTSYTNDSGE